MLINFSNHPSDLWEEHQLTAARQFGEIVDVPFPDVSPTWTAEEIKSLADEYATILMKKCDSSTIVHVMGEMTFTFAVVSRLKAQGIVCVASTTERNAQITPNGQKLSDFQFVQFREY